jgi:hypothetical protein
LAVKNINNEKAHASGIGSHAVHCHRNSIVCSRQGKKRVHLQKMFGQMQRRMQG